MNRMQDEIACKVLTLLNEHNGHLTKSGLLDRLEKEIPNNNDKEIWFVVNRLLNDYKLIYESNSWICLSSDGEVAVNIGVDRYIRKLHKNKRLDLKMKQLEVISKILSILKDSKVILTALVAALTTGLIYGLILSLKAIL